MADLGLELKDHAPRKKMLCYTDKLYTMPPQLNPAFFYQYLTGKHVLSGAISAGLAFRRHARNPARVEALENDMSIADFLRSTFGDIPAPWNVLSGMMHGIYGGSIESLSLPSVLPGFWYGMLMPRKLGKQGEFVPRPDLELMEELDPSKRGQEFAERVKQWCVSEVLTFEGGMERLVDAIRKELEKEGVKFIAGEPVTGIRYKNAEDKVEVCHADCEPHAALV
jgi:protoporphyrinogen oxidase